NHLPGEFFLFPGTNEKEIARTEATLKIEFPDDFRESYRIHNGMPELVLFENHQLLPLEQIVEVWKGYRAGCDEYIRWCQSTGAPNPKVGPMKTLWWRDKWIPFLHSPGASSFCLDMDPPPDGTVGQVIEFAIETGPSRVLAKGFREWVS